MIYRLCICICFTTGIQLTNYKIKITNMENPEIRWESMCKLSFGWLCVTPVRSHKTVSWRQATREYHLTSCTELLQTTPSPICTKMAHIYTLACQTSHVHHMYSHVSLAWFHQAKPLCPALSAQVPAFGVSTNHYNKLPRFSNTCIKFDPSNMKDYLPLRSIYDTILVAPESSCVF